jgi:hypothetical protein
MQRIGYDKEGEGEDEHEEGKEGVSGIWSIYTVRNRKG